MKSKSIIFILLTSVLLQSCNNSLAVVTITYDQKESQFTIEKGTAVTMNQLVPYTIYGKTIVGAFASPSHYDKYRGELINEDIHFWIPLYSWEFGKDLIVCIFPQLAKECPVISEMLIDYDNEVFIDVFNDYYLKQFQKEFGYEITTFYWDYHSKNEEFINPVELIELSSPRTSENFYVIYGEINLAL